VRNFGFGKNTFKMKYPFSLLMLVFAFCISSLNAQVHDATQSADALDLWFQDSVVTTKPARYQGNLEYIERLRQDVTGSGKVNIIQDYRIDDMLKIDKNVNSEAPGFLGYRIQIFSGGGRDREKAFSIREDLETRFPDQRVYVKYQAPDFRVRIGNFRNKFEAMYLYKQCVKIYPYCYVVKDQISLLDLEVEETTDIVIEEIE